MTTGVIQHWNDERGYGFVTPDGARENIFLHAVAVKRAGLSSLRIGDRLEFDVELDASRRPRVRSIISHQPGGQR